MSRHFYGGCSVSKWCRLSCNQTTVGTHPGSRMRSSIAPGTAAARESTQPGPAPGSPEARRSMASSSCSSFARTSDRGRRARDLGWRRCSRCARSTPSTRRPGCEARDPGRRLHQPPASLESGVDGLLQAASKGNARAAAGPLTFDDAHGGETGLVARRTPYYDAKRCPPRHFHGWGPGGSRVQIPPPRPTSLPPAIPYSWERRSNQ